MNLWTTGPPGWRLACVCASGAAFLGASLACGWTGPRITDNDRDGFTSDEDCDDDNGSVHPGAVERCNRSDDDCNGVIDDYAVDAPTHFADEDGDGFGDPSARTFACDPPNTYVSNSDDCDDLRRDTYPGAPELCDGRDNDCDAIIDNDVADLLTFWADADADGFGDPSTMETGCQPPSGFVENDQDCDDTRADVSPDMPEICGDSVDNDCIVDTADSCGFDLTALGRDTATLLPRGADAQLGWSVAGVGDVDDDGYDDILAGSPALSVLADGAWLVPGPITGRDDIAVVGDLLEVGEGAEQAGRAVGGGDANDDGYADIVVGAPEGVDGAIAPGIVSLRYGPEPIGCEPSCKGATLVGEADDDRAGASLDLADVTGDGLDDLIIGAPGAGGRGRVYLVQGPPTGRSSLADARAILEGSSEGGAAGDATAAGDIDNDGRADVVTVDPLAGDGAVYLMLGSLRGSVSLADADARIELGPETSRIHVDLGDVTGDGVDDLIIGGARSGTSPATDVVWIFSEPGSGVLTLDDATSTINGSQVWANGGTTVAAGGDFNRDGLDDLLVGALRSETWLPSDDRIVIDQPGSVYALAGPIPDGTFALSQATARLVAPERRDLAILSVAFGGDLNRDGHDEIIVGARRHAGAFSNGGVVWIASGRGL